MARTFSQILIIFLCCFAADHAEADSWAFPTTKDYYSSDGAVRFSVIPSREFGSARTKTIGILSLKKNDAFVVVWRAALNNLPVMALVSDDGGHVVTFDSHHSAGYGENVIVIYDERGSASRRFALNDFLTEGHISRLTHSVSSIWWHCEAQSRFGDKYLYVGVRLGELMHSECQVVKINLGSFELDSNIDLSGANAKNETTSDQQALAAKYFESILAKTPAISKIIRHGSQMANRTPDFQTKIIRDIEQKLRESSPNINELDQFGYSALDFSLSSDLSQVALFLLEKGADPTMNYQRWDSPFSKAVMRDNVELIEAMINAGADLKRYNSKEQNALGTAIRLESNEALALLLEIGMDPNVSKNGEQLPLQEAIMNHNWYAVKLLLQYGASGASIHSYAKMLLSAYENRPDKTIELLISLEGGFNGEYTPEAALMVAVNRNHTGLIRRLVAHGVSVNAEFGLWGSTPLIEAVIKGNLESVMTLIELGASINHSDEYGFSALDVATLLGRKAIHQFLNSRGAEELIGVSKIIDPLEQL